MFKDLTYILRSQGIGDDDVAESLNVSEERFRACRQGKATFTKAERTAVASLLGMSEDWLFSSF